MPREMHFSASPSLLAQPMRQKLLVKDINNHPGTGPRDPLILIVEDDDDLRQWMLSALAGNGISCVAAASVVEAIAALQDNRIALTVLDWELDRSGAAVLEEAKAHYPLMPVVVISGRPYDVRTDAMVARADAFLAKPFSATVLLSQVRQLLERAKVAPRILFPEAPADIRPLGEIKEEYIRHVVHLLNDNASLAAEKLGIHRQTVSAALKPGAVQDCDVASERYSAPTSSVLWH
jgi:DNA-binding response OmpR family regulator